MKNKNIAPFNGTTLLEHKIETLKRVPEVTRIVVSSDSAYMLELAKARGADIHVRPPEYCDEVSLPFSETVRLVCSEVEGDHILWAPCTSPLVSPALYSKAIRIYLEAISNGYDSLISVQLFKHFMWNETEPLNYELGEKQVPSQQLPNLYVVTNGILLAPRGKTIEWKYTYGRNPYKLIIEKTAAVDIDDELDLLQAEAWLRANRERFPEYC